MAATKDVISDHDRINLLPKEIFLSRTPAMKKYYPRSSVGEEQNINNSFLAISQYASFTTLRAPPARSFYCCIYKYYDSDIITNSLRNVNIIISLNSRNSNSRLVHCPFQLLTAIVRGIGKVRCHGYDKHLNCITAYESCL